MTRAEALRAHNSARAAIAANAARRAELKEQGGQHRAGAAEARDTLLKEQAAALAGDVKMDERRAADLERAERQGQRKADALDRVATDLAADMPGLNRALVEAEADLANAVLHGFRADRDGPAGIALDTLERLGGALAAAMAAELVRDHLIGTRFSFDSKLHPSRELWSPVFIVRKFLDAVPAQLAPPNFRARVQAEARRVAAEVLARLEKEEEN